MAWSRLEGWLRGDGLGGSGFNVGGLGVGWVDGLGVVLFGMWPEVARKEEGLNMGSVVVGCAGGWVEMEGISEAVREGWQICVEGAELFQWGAVKSDLDKAHQEEEQYWRNKSRALWLKAGDCNSNVFRGAFEETHCGREMKRMR
ncbi:UPF0042 nucleotide-binding protein TM1040_2438 [Striga asiatica]|uniref:UPF0042 nucleotide-binding protein TM1040_2438 n=1 Tax=Striga asiatica TaxID=4170 RepID=A0A5A7PIQ8_STRAF|nr:UPF0042 nucleotide-binding protein TM1040_2438 [Striga asiatica]